jgi:protein-S-isoprenylcysteine O-methyltransferase Ste14
MPQFQPKDSRLHDFLGGLPLILFCGFALSGFAILLPGQWGAAHRNYPLILSELASAIFLAMELVLLFIRRLPLNKAAGLRPRLWAFVAANLGYVQVLFPRAPISGTLALVSMSVILAGTLGSVATLFWLGRSFAIFPQARRLVTSGPYRFVRHPLYVCEQLALLGVSLQYIQPWGILTVIVSFALQFPRMNYEEKVLAETFPEYSAYALRTPRLIPFLAAREL